MQIDLAIARKVLETVDAGLCSGLGEPTPGKMCVEAAVCYAMGLPHGDEPACVAPALRSLKIRLNDSCWSSSQARAQGLRRLALAQLGSAGVLDGREFSRRVAPLAIRICVPMDAAAVSSAWRYLCALCSAAAAHNAAYAAAAAAAAVDAAAAAAADAAAADRMLAAFAEGVVEVLIEMKAPGCQWLALTEGGEIAA